MKKIIFILTLLLSAFTVNAQTTVQTSKLLDNTYVGVQAGVNTPLSFNQMFPVNEYAGIRVGKNLTPVFGLNVDAGVTFNDHANGHTNGFVNHFASHAAVNTVNVGLNGTVNLMNLFGSYKSSPRLFEVSTVTGLGWSHIYNKTTGITNTLDDDELVAKTGADFAFNLGKKKAWQIYAEPSVVWNLTNRTTDNVRFNKDHAYLQLLVGVNYKFKTSNGTHNFKVYDIAAMNEEINSLRSKLAKKPKEVVKTVTNTVDNRTFVIFFAQNSDELTPTAKEVLDKISGTVDVTGFASPEGTSEYNLKLSERRANAVANYLKNKGVTVDVVTGLGVQGKATNRVVIVNKK
jgi:hypothetical protein